MRNSLLYVLYKFDAELFISMFCENKNRPQLHCNGKCKLAKMLKEEKNEEATKVLKQLQSDVVFCFPQKWIGFSRQESTVSNEKHLTGYQNLYTFLFMARNYRPPQV